ncbi:MAG: twitching motility protein PilT [Candidatus Bathyarchaeota archaeon B24]|nr:MAG: twitching motility protein PilT [Candidatus Bathyarchaeota archaeon B24]RLI25152.1 MAG: PIN domain nuclease [Candidatus Bathyarchaeota archaeon]
MAGRVYVVDASVVLKWFVSEDYSKEAEALREAYANGLIDLAAPSLLPYEVLNALKYSTAFGEDELKEVAEVLDDLQITYYGLQKELAAKAVEIAMRKGVTVYGSSYLALAHRLQTIVYTADERLIRKTRDTRLVEHIAKFNLL